MLGSQAGDDATAALATILFHHNRRVAFDDIRRAIYADGGDYESDGVNANQFVVAAATFGLHAYGVMVEAPSGIPRLPTPNLAHMLRTRGAFGRALEHEPQVFVGRGQDRVPRLQADAHFAVVAAASTRRVEWIDPREGLKQASLEELASMSSGVFILFKKARPLPPAKLIDG